MKNAIIFGLLFCLVTLNLPKAFFHSHEEHQEHHVENDWESSFSADEAHCFVCDVDLLNFSAITYHAVKFDPKAIVHGKEHVYLLEKSNHYELHQLRGPPSFNDIRLN